MRIIGGIHRSRTILAPPDARTTRPITDRVKQSLFDRLTHMGALNGHALDIFSGTGSLGLEALSREMAHCTFIERDRTARQLLEKNLDSLGLSQQATVLNVDALAPNWLALLPHRPVSLIFCDPPYKLTERPTDLARVMRLVEALAAVTEPAGILMLRTERHSQPPPPAKGWEGPQRLVFGSMALHLYQRN